LANLDANDLGDRLHRLVKLAMDTGEASTLEEAQIIFSAYRLGVRLGPDALGSPAHQAALRTIANAGVRSFLGGVVIQGVPLMPRCSCRFPVTQRFPSTSRSGRSHRSRNRRGHSRCRTRRCRRRCRRPPAGASRHLRGLERRRGTCCDRNSTGGA
jgi:hypothetical protein